MLRIKPSNKDKISIVKDCWDMLLSNPIAASVLMLVIFLIDKLPTEALSSLVAAPFFMFFLHYSGAIRQGEGLSYALNQLVLNKKIVLFITGVVVGIAIFIDVLDLLLNLTQESVNENLNGDSSSKNHFALILTVPIFIGITDALIPLFYMLVYLFTLEPITRSKSLEFSFQIIGKNWIWLMFWTGVAGMALNLAALYVFGFDILPITKGILLVFCFCICCWVFNVPTKKKEKATSGILKKSFQL